MIGIAVLGILALYSIGIRHKNPVIPKPLSLNSSPSTTTSSNSVSSQGTVSSARQYKDGSYVGSVTDAYYGNVQVQAVIAGGRISDVKFLQYPNTHSTSVMINQQAMPYLTQEAIQAQSSNVQVITGATFTSQAFQQSLQAALSQA